MLLKIRRFLAVYIDFVIIFYLCYYPFYILDIFDNIYYSIFLSSCALVLFFNIFLIKDCIFGYESIGKKIMFLKIYHNGDVLKDKKILKDRVYFSIWNFPIYPFMILINNKSSGDNKFGTIVK
ncbi:MAG: hypothetical protein HFI49_02580 [Bacilli bacterium]|jgi:hypothetical protein|nr:hypothetical protein [Bacilli bacterium]